MKIYIKFIGFLYQWRILENALIECNLIFNDIDIY